MLEINGVHNEWNNFPLHTLIGRQVKITLTDNSTREGIVYTVDNVSRNFFLVQPSEDAHQFHTVVVFGKVIQNVRVFDYVKTNLDLSNDDFLYILHPGLKSQATLNTRKANIKTLLENSFGVEVKEDKKGVLHLQSIAIEPPYTPASCVPEDVQNTNAVVLSRIQTALAKVGI